LVVDDWCFLVYGSGLLLADIGSVIVVRRVIIGDAILEGAFTLLLSEQDVSMAAVRALSSSYWQRCLGIGVVAGVIVDGNAGTGVHVVVL
jgi:hypothetical protein